MRPKDTWLFVFFAGMLAFNWPLLAIFESRLPAYLFTAWLALIFCVRLLVTRRARDDEGG